VRLGLTQPLLRGFGAPNAKATIRLARNQQRRSMQDLRAELLRIAQETESAYWDLALAWKVLAISEWLVEVGVEVRGVLKDRFEVFDAQLSEYSDSVAVVEQRKADVIRARRAVRAASDRLKVLLNADDITVGSELLIAPVDSAVESSVSYNLAEAIRTALERRPEIAQALLGIDDADVRRALAENLRLPLLDLNAQMSYVGLDREPGDSYDETMEGSFIDYVLGLVFEYPLGNRAADATFRRARLERSGAMIRYRQAVQNVIADLKAALRDVLTNYELIQATRSFRIAQAENLRALLAQEELRAAMTPEFLNLKFQRQATLAQAQRQEFEALSNYNKSVAELHRAMGVGLDVNGIDVEVVDADAVRD
jgi:outer membrane protein TolC